MVRTIIVHGPLRRGQITGLIIAFVLGVIIGAFVAEASGKGRKQAVLTLVTIMLSIAALLDGAVGGAWPAVTMAAAMGAENAVFQRDGEVSVGLTYMTGTLVKFGQHFASALRGGPRWHWAPYLLLWCSLTCGAIVGTIVNLHASSIAIALAAVAAAGVTVYAARMTTSND